MVGLSMGKKPEIRYQHGDQFAADLGAFIAALSASPAPAAATSIAAPGAPVTDTEMTLVFSTTTQPSFEKTIAAQAPTDLKL